LEAALPDGHWSPSDARSVLGECLVAEGRLEDAEPLLLAGYEGLVAARGAEHPRSRAALERIAALYDAYMTISTPGNDPYVLTVGAMNDLNTAARADDVITTYSSRGPSFGDHVLKPDLVAPGNRIVSSLAPNAGIAELFPERVVATHRIELSGSSMAAGVVSGAAALLFERNPFLTNDQIKAILMFSAEDVADENPFAIGAGQLQVVRAIAMTGPFSSVRFNSTSPILHHGEEDNTFFLSDADALAGNTALWTDPVRWSDGD
jgi:serine protease AprX